MVKLSRKCSVQNICTDFVDLDPRRLTTCDWLPRTAEIAVESGKAEDDNDASCWSQLAEVDCGFCTLSLRREPDLAGLAHLRIRPGASSSSWLRGSARRSAECLEGALTRLLTAGVDFVAVYDLRGTQGKGRPEADLAKALAKFRREHGELWEERLKSAALLIEDNIFTAAVAGPVVGFIKACALACPFVVCHGEAAAEEFFRAGAAPQAVAPFVSITSVVDMNEMLKELHAPARPDQDFMLPTCAPNKRPGHSSTASDASTSASTSSGAGTGASASAGARAGAAVATRACFASLAPLRSLTATAGSAGAAAATNPHGQHTFHLLPNGDMRVIQSMPTDVMLTQPRGMPDAGCPARGRQRQAPAASGDLLLGTGSGDLAAGLAALGCGNPASGVLGALRFECPRERLLELIGAHFHIGELVVDAEIESVCRRRIRSGNDKLRPAGRILKAGMESTARCGSVWCLTGIRILLASFAKRFHRMTEAALVK